MLLMAHLVNYDDCIGAYRADGHNENKGCGGRDRPSDRRLLGHSRPADREAVNVQTPVSAWGLRPDEIASASG